MSFADGGPSPVPVTCARCGFVWGEGSIVGKHWGHGRDNDGRKIVVCIERRYCRARSLSGEVYQDLMFARETRERLRQMMDVRPKKWKEIGWRQAYYEWQRVDACLTYHSVCFPASVKYACVLNADDNDILEDRYTGAPVPLREADIANLLNIHQPNVNRALRELYVRKRWVKDDGRFLYVAQPGEISLAERVGLWGNELDRAAADVDPKWADRLKGIPRKFLAGFAGALRELADPQVARLIEERTGRDPGDLRSEMFSRLTQGIDFRNSRIKEGRTHLTDACWDTREWLSIILSRDIEVRAVRTSAAPSVPEPTPSPEANAPVDEAEDSPINQQYTEPPQSPAGGEDRVAPYTEEEISLVYFRIRAWQLAFPKTDFGRDPVSREHKGDRVTVGQVLRALAGADLRLFLAGEAYHFSLEPNSLGKKEARSPAHPNGPRHFGILIDRARRYRQTHGANRGEWERLQGEEREEADRMRAREESRVEEARLEEVLLERAAVQLDRMSPAEQLRYLGPARKQLEAQWDERWQRLSQDERYGLVRNQAIRILAGELAGKESQMGLSGSAGGGGDG